MGTIWLRDFKGGLDTRRMAETLPGGSAIRAVDGHVTRGGEFEQRAAFVEEYTLPAGQTVGLGYGKNGLYVFGHGPAPVMPRGVTYQRLQHPDGGTTIARLLSFDLFASKIYAVAEFTDGSIYHYYDGARISDWQDGRSRTSFVVVSGGSQPAIAASGSFTVTGGSASIVNTFANIKLNGVSIIAAPVAHTGDNDTTAAAIAAAINSTASFPDYTASAAGPVVTITAATPGPASNGFAPTLTLNGDVSVGSVTALSGGAAVRQSRLQEVLIDGMPITEEAVYWDVSNENTASLIATAINDYASDPDYTATAVGSKVNVLAADAGAANNGRTRQVAAYDNLDIQPAASLLANGLDPGSVFQSGTFAKTIGSKVYVCSGPNLNFSGIKTPTGFQSGNVGAGFIDMSTEAAGSEALQAVAKYLQYIAVFAGRVTQIWYVDPDPLLNKQTQVLNNMGTLSPRSVTQFGDNDLFFLDESGVRSLRARDASNAASTTDIGIPVDTLVVAKLRALSALQRSRLVGLIEPTDGRFWLIFPDEIFVFSFFEGSKISAWSTYTPAIDNVPFVVDDGLVFKKKVYLRSGDKIISYGGLKSLLAYDTTSPELWLPYLDANAPSRAKDFNGVDVACEGKWQVTAGTDPTRQEVADKIGVVTQSTYGEDRMPFEASGRHISLRFKGVGAGPKKIAAAAIHFVGEKSED